MLSAVQFESGVETIFNALVAMVFISIICHMICCIVSECYVPVDNYLKNMYPSRPLLQFSVLMIQSASDSERVVQRTRIHACIDTVDSANAARIP